MSDLSLDLATRDVAIDDEGNAPLVSGDDELVQRCSLVAYLQRGLWEFDLSAGMPWRERVLVRNPDLGAVSASLRTALLAVPGVERVTIDALAVTDGILRGRATINGAVEVVL